MIQEGSPMKNEILILQAEKEMLKELQKISIETFVETFGEYNSEEDMNSYIKEDLSLESLRKETETPGSVFFLAYREGKVCGYIKINFNKAQSEEGNKETAELQRIYIKEEFQGMKIGQKLLDFAIERAKNNNLKKLWLGVWEHNHKAIRFYEKNKFKKFSEHSFVLGEDVQLDYLYERDLLENV